MNFSLPSQLKSDARERLFGHYGRLIYSLITMELIIYLLDYIAQSVTYKMAFGNIFYFIFVFLISIFIGVLYAGNAYLYLNFTTGAPTKATDIFHSFKYHTDKAIILQFIFTICQLICFAPSTLLIRYYLAGNDSVFLMFGFFCLLIGIVIDIIVYLHLTLAFYMIHDFPDYGVKKLIKMCLYFMKGNKGKLLRLELSFIPIYLLGILSFGIGLLWAMPYVFTTRTLFYLELVDRKSH